VKSFIATLAVCLMLSTPSAAQTRSRRSTTQRNRTPAPASRLDQTKLNAIRLQLAEQVKDMTRFLYLYGRVSKDLELTSAQTNSSDVAARGKASLVQSIRDLRDRLDNLEGQFRFTQGLEPKYRLIQGVSRRAEEAASFADAGRYDQAGRTLVEISNQLADVLIEL
jgi:hypothetical protein